MTPTSSSKYTSEDHKLASAVLALVVTAIVCGGIGGVIGAWVGSHKIATDTVEAVTRQMRITPTPCAVSPSSSTIASGRPK